MSEPARAAASQRRARSLAHVDSRAAPPSANTDATKRKRDAAGQDTGIYAHQLRVYLVDRQRRIRNIYGLGFLDPRLLLTDVLTLLAEEGAPRGQAE